MAWKAVEAEAPAGHTAGAQRDICDGAIELVPIAAAPANGNGVERNLGIHVGCANGTGGGYSSSERRGGGRGRGGGRRGEEGRYFKFSCRGLRKGVHKKDLTDVRGAYPPPTAWGAEPSRDHEMA